VSRTPADALRWTEEGTRLFLDAVVLGGDSLLPGWSRAHVAAHVAANAQGLTNLTRWAITGIRTPMYASPEDRAAGIERGLAMRPAELEALLRRSAAALASSMRQMSPEHWTAEVVTAQGRTVPATEIPWLRAREVCVHVVDLDVGVGFADLPADFLEALCVDVVAKRVAGPDQGGPLAERAAWLTGRPHRLEGAPQLGPWL
jgi:maleylpyruvate isomerase